MTYVRRVMISFRLSRTLLWELDARAEEEKLTRTDLLRLMIVFCLTNMPRKWRP